MAKFAHRIIITASDEPTSRSLHQLLQSACDQVNEQDLYKLLSKVRQNPSLIKTALKFI